MTYNELKDKILKIIQARRKAACSHQDEVIDLLRDYFTEELTDVTYINRDIELFNKFIRTPLIDIACSVVRDTDYRNKTIMDLFNLEGNASNQVNQVLEDVVKEVITEPTTFIDNLILEHLISHNNPAYLYIRFPKVTVTNEDDKSVDIDELYVLVPINEDGTLNRGFSMVRSSYSMIQWLSGYSHSHLPKISTEYVPNFDYPCLGSGPLKHTQVNLRCAFNIDMWGLFAFELEKYVTQESLTGVPYIKLESIGKSSEATEIKLHYKETLEFLYGNTDFKPRNNIDFKDFLTSYCSHTNLNVSYKEGQYSLGITDVNFVISLSNYFIKWYNNKVAEGVYCITLDDLIYNNTLNKVIIDGNKVYSNAVIKKIDNIKRLEGAHLTMSMGSTKDFIFKGEPVKLHIDVNFNIKNKNYALLLNTDICSYILTKILEVINNKYGASN